MAHTVVSPSPPHGRTRDTDALPRLGRLFKVLTILASKRAGETIGRAKLAAACECDVRTVSRDIEILSGGGAFVEYNAKKRSYSLADSGWHFPIASWTLEDTLALAFARTLLSTSDIPQHADIGRALDKATGSLSPGLKQLMADAAAVVHVGRGPRDYSHAPVSELADAAARHESVEIDYDSRSSGERVWRRVDPYRIEHLDRQFLHLHAWCHGREAIRVFALDRIFAVRGTGMPFEINEPVWAEYAAATGIVGGLRGGQPLAVEVRFSPLVAAYALERTWTDGLHVSQNPDGSALLTGTVLGTDGIIGDLLRWKRHAVVLGGAELRAAMMEIRAVAGQYR